MNKNLNDNIKRMSEYLDEEAIARALGVEVGLVKGVLNGEVVEEKKAKIPGAIRSPSVKYVQASFRQRVISVVRMKGGIGATTLTANLARYLSERNKVLVVDMCASVTEVHDLGLRKRKVSSDILEIFEVEFFKAENGPEVLEIDTNLHYIPVSGGRVKEFLYEARQEYDQIIIDLPNMAGYETDALEASTTLLILFSGRHSEAERLLELNNIDREKVLAAHIKLSPEGKNLVEEHLEADNYLQIPEFSGIASLKSPAYQGIAQISAMLFGNGLGEDKKGLLGMLFGAKGK